MIEGKVLNSRQLKDNTFVHVTLKTQIFCCFWREHWQDRERSSFSCSFVFLLNNQKKMLLTLFAPNQHAAALVVDCRGVNSALFLYGYDFCTVQLSKQDKKREHALKKDQWLFSQTCFILSDAKYLLSILLCSDVGKPPCFMCSLHLQTVWYVV